MGGSNSGSIVRDEGGGNRYVVTSQDVGNF